MNLYEKHILPRLIHLAMRNKAATAERVRYLYKGVAQRPE